MNDIILLRDLAVELEDLNDRQKSEDGNFSCFDQMRLLALQQLEEQLGSVSLRDKDIYELISISHWQEYCHEYAEDCGFTTSDSPLANPLLDYVDWTAWAAGVAEEYKTVEFDGDTYYYRSLL